ncbi:hypothetical protein D3C79_845010 [compost metagenome]
MIDHFLTEGLAASDQLGDALGFLTGKFSHPFWAVVACGPTGDGGFHVGIEAVDLGGEQPFDNHATVFINDALDDFRRCSSGYFLHFCRSLDFRGEHDVLRSVKTEHAPATLRSMTGS